MVAAAAVGGPEAKSVTVRAGGDGDSKVEAAVVAVAAEDSSAVAAVAPELEFVVTVIAVANPSEGFVPEWSRLASRSRILVSWLLLLLVLS